MVDFIGVGSGGCRSVVLNYSAFDVFVVGFSVDIRMRFSCSSGKSASASILTSISSRRGRKATHHQEPGPQGGIGREWGAGSPGVVGGPLGRARGRHLGPGEGPSPGAFGASDRRAAVVRAVVAG